MRALPAIVRRRVAIGQRPSARPSVLEPGSAHAALVDVERQAQTAPGSSMPETSRATRRSSPRAITSTGFSSSSASTGLVSQRGCRRSRARGPHAGEGEAPGRWRGNGAARLGLSGRCQGGRGRPAAGRRAPGLRRAARRADGRRIGRRVDLTFTTPKSVSVAFGIGDPPTPACCANVTTARSTTRWDIGSTGRSGAGRWTRAPRRARDARPVPPRLRAEAYVPQERRSVPVIPVGLCCHRRKPRQRPRLRVPPGRHQHSNTTTPSSVHSCPSAHVP